MLRYLTAGESHGKALVALVDGFPAGVELSGELIDAELRRRQGGLRPRRTATARIRSRRNPQRPVARQDHRQPHRPARIPTTTQDRADWTSAVPAAGPRRSCRLDQAPRLDPRRVGAGQRRETAARVAAGALARQLLDPFGIAVFGYVVEVGPIVVRRPAGHSRPAAGNTRQKRTLHPEPRPGRRNFRLHRPGGKRRGHFGRRH